jgi:MFS family permease
MPFFFLAVVLVGAAGFLAGFLGPIALTPEANQGPLLGILITGPLGFVAGAILGFVLPRTVPQPWRIKVLVAFAVTTVAGILAALACLRGPEFVGRLYFAEVTNPRPAVEQLPAAIKKWEDLARQYQHQPKADWQTERRRLVDSAGGSIVTLKQVSVWYVHRQRQPWNKGRYTFTPQPAENERDAYLAPNVSLASPGWFLATASGVPADWPPANIGDFLGVVEISTAPAEFRPPER